MLQEAINVYIASLSMKEDERGNRNTIMAYRNDLNQLCCYLTSRGVESWCCAKREHVAQYLLEMREEHSYRPTTIARKLAAFKSFFRYLRHTDTIACDPIETLESPRIARDLPQVLSVEQVNSLFCQVDQESPAGKRDLAMLHMLYATGMRASELVALNLEDFDPERAVVICPGKNGRISATRELPLPAAVVEVIQRYLELARPYLSRNTTTPSLFLNHHGDRLTRQGFWLIIKGYARQANITDITPHMLRHSFAIVMLKEGMELRAVQALLGHAHVSTTQVYSQLAMTLANK